MRKIKMLMLGLLSVLTLGLFVVTGTKVNATTVETGYEAISILSLKNNDSEYSTYGSKPSGKGQDVTNDYIAFAGNWNWYKTGIVETVAKDVINNTGCSFDSFVITSSSNRVINLKVPSNKTKISIIIYVLSMVKAGNDGNYTLKDGGSITIDIPNTVSNLKLDDTEKTSITSITGDKTIHKLSFDYESSTAITLNSGQAVLGFGVKDASTKYSISYDANGHGTAPVYEGEDVSSLSDSILAESISVSNWRFTGWYFEAACTNKATTSSDLATYADNGSVTLYAGWEEIASYNIYFYNGSTLVSTKEVAISGTKKLTDWPTDPTKTGWTFVGWFNGETQVDTDTVFTGDTTLKARFSSNNKIAIGSTATLNYNDSSLTINSSSYYDSQTLGKFFIDSTSSKIKKDNSFKFEVAGSTVKDYISFDIPANSKAKVVLNGMRSTDSSKTATFELTDGINTINPSTSVAKDTNSYYTIFVNNSSEDQTVYLYRKSTSNAKINEIIVSVIALDNDSIVDNSNLIFKTQYDASTAAASSKLRFIGYIQGVTYADYANIESIQFSFTFNEKDRVATVNNLYKSVKNGNDVMLGAFDNAMYVVYTLRGINKETYEGKTLTNCKLTVNFVGGSSLEVSHDDITLPSKFDSYYTES